MLPTQPLPWTLKMEDGEDAVLMDDNGMWVADFGNAPVDAAYAAFAATEFPKMHAKVQTLTLLLLKTLTIAERVVRDNQIERSTDSFDLSDIRSEMDKLNA